MFHRDDENHPLFVVTVDTEADDAWGNKDSIELKNLKQVPRFQQLCEEYGVVPTYLVAYECATRDEAISVLKPIVDAGRCEIGHHLHSWTTPPFEKEGPPGVDAAWVDAYQSELPDSLFREKAECLYKEIERAYGKAPTSHRAGRWGIDQRSVDWLIDNGFVAESSVIPLLSYSTTIGKAKGGPSFHGLPREPYLWYGKSVRKKENAFVTEIPLTVDVPASWAQKCLAKYVQCELPAAIIAAKLFRRVGGGRSLRPNPRYPENSLLQLIERVMKGETPVLNLMIHSSELLLGGSPFSKSPDDLTRLWNGLEDVFIHVKALGITSTSLSQAAVAVASSQQRRSAEAKLE